ncbi:MAG TPA: UDP-3-O-acyl-N-acetylglucosamine deacetylase [bacterium]|nr:UDP-3-O-acyl-N-acetylglucosamine deacetylase [bacterium]
MSVPRRTIARPVAAAGEGIHTASPAAVTLRPADAGSGIVFHRADLRAAPAIPARFDHVTDTRRGVTLGASGASVRTVEHLLAACSGLGITDLHVEVRGEELPALDGSAAPYCALLAEAGVVSLDARVEPLRPSEPVWVGAAEASLLAVAAPALRVTYVVPLRHPALGPALSADLVLTEEVFVREVAPARTWGFAAELGALRAEGLARGASTANALVVGPPGYLNPPRWPDEPARHKILDLLGDLALVGRPLAAHLIAVGAGHRLHVAFARALAGG